MNPAEIPAHLDQYTCTEKYHRHPMIPAELLLFTDGAVEAAKIMDCWWLLEAIGFQQFGNRIRNNARRKSFIVWRLVVKDGVGVLTAHEDWDEKDPSEFPPFITVPIHGTDFPLPEFTLWQEGNILLLPSEH